MDQSKFAASGPSLTTFDVHVCEEMRGKDRGMQGKLHGWERIWCFCFFPKPRAKKFAAELRKALEAKDAELLKVQTDLDAECRSCTNVEQLHRELREAIKLLLNRGNVAVMM
jgi:hypothetical protein